MKSPTGIAVALLIAAIGLPSVLAGARERTLDRAAVDPDPSFGGEIGDEVIHPKLNQSF